MSHPGTRFYFDFVDPLSYLLELELRAIERSVPIRAERLGFELVPPPAPLSALDDPRWAARWAEARPAAAAAGVLLDPPRLVPWTRKAHELHLHAHEHGKADEVRFAIFTAYFGRGEDIGRVDRLVEIAVALGLDAAAARTVLGVDRHEEDVVAARGAAAAAGVSDVPAILVPGGPVRGFHNRGDLGTLLGP
jgi:predicted DsbA family dithiol-disulfide isomerase